MAILKIHEFPDPVLKSKAKSVTEFDGNLRTLVEDMLETMYAAPGVGLAANQVGVLLRVLVLDADFSVESSDGDILVCRNQNPRVLINPEILTKHGKFLYQEGCLSVPGVTEEVERSKKITVSYCTPAGEKKELEAEGLLAVIIQHEIDHLEGRLFIDRLSAIKKSMITGKIKKGTLERRERSRLHVDL